MSDTRMVNVVAGLLENAGRFAKVYVTISDALIKEGVPEQHARSTAQAMAMHAALLPEVPITDIRDEWER